MSCAIDYVKERKLDPKILEITNTV